MYAYHRKNALLRPWKENVAHHCDACMLFPFTHPQVVEQLHSNSLTDAQLALMRPISQR